MKKKNVNSTKKENGRKINTKKKNFGSNISSTKSDFNIQVNNNLFHEIKLKFFPAVIVSVHYLNSSETLGEKARCKLRKDAVCCFEQILVAGLPHNNNCLATHLPSGKSSK